MTKEQYYEMCEQLGTEPIETEVPVDINELPIEVQRAFSIYRYLPDINDSMTGYYGGKDFSPLASILAIKNIEDQDVILDFITYINSEYTRSINKNKSSSKPTLK